MTNNTEFSTRTFYKLIKNQTGKRVSEDAADELAEQIQGIAEELAQEAQSFTEMKDRKTVRAEDVQNALGSRRRQVIEEEGFGDE